MIKGLGVSSQSSALPLSTTIQSKLLSLITSLFSSRWWEFSSVGQVMVWGYGEVMRGKLGHGLTAEVSGF